MSFAGEMLNASRTDAFRITAEMPAEELEKLDLRLVQGFKKTGSSIEIKFADIPKLCELADRYELADSGEAVERRAVNGGAVGKDGGRGAERLRELFDMCEGAADKDEDSDEGSGMGVI